MPRGNGMGPAGAGPGSGRGMNAGQSRGRGRMGGLSLGSGGNCVCIKCGNRIAHQRATPCNQLKCPSCGAAMTREQ